MGTSPFIRLLSRYFIKNDTETESSIQRGGIVASRFQPQCFHQIQRTLLRKRIYCLCCSHLAILADSSDGSPELLSFLLGYHYFEHLLGFICLQKHQICPQTQGCYQKRRSSYPRNLQKNGGR